MRRDARSLQQLQDFKNRYPKRWTTEATQLLSNTITNYANNLNTDIDVKDKNSYFDTNLEEACFKILRNSLRTAFNLPSMHGPFVNDLNTLQKNLVGQIDNRSLDPWERGGIVKRLAFVTEDLKKSGLNRDTGNKREELKKDDALRAKLRDAIEEFRLVKTLLKARLSTHSKTFADNAITAYIELHDGSFQTKQDLRRNEDTLERFKEFSKSLKPTRTGMLTIHME